jgi:hypothetical protein
MFIFHTWVRYTGSNYEVSTLGEVRHARTKIILKQQYHHRGYLTVKIVVDGKLRNMKVHRMVADCFLKPIARKELVNHKDTIKYNNVVTNLDRMNTSENTKHAYDNGLIDLEHAKSFRKGKINFGL